MIEKQSETPHACQCSHCAKDPTSSIAELHCQINQLVALLNEKERRQLVGLLARQLGQGGVTLMAQVTGLSRTTIRRGQAELLSRERSDRIRTKGGGRPRVEKKRLGC